MKTQEIAEQFVVKTVNSINESIGVELARNGFSLEKIKKGEQKLVRTFVQSDDDPRFMAETYSVKTKYKGKDLERIIMSVKWRPNGFTIEVNSDEIANAVAKSPDFRIKRAAAPIQVENMTRQEVEIEILAEKKMQQYNAIKGLN